MLEEMLGLSDSMILDYQQLQSIIYSHTTASKLKQRLTRECLEH